MGVPALFRWLSTKYPKIISQVVEEKPVEQDGVMVPVDITKPNPNGEEMDNLYLDMNGIVHPCSHPEDKAPPANEEEMMLEIFKYTERVVNMVRPRKLLMIAVDGVAPRAKMNQQRSRRFRSAQEAKEKDEQKAELYELMKRQNPGKAMDEESQEQAEKKTWDSNAITPGTPFMFILAANLRYWCQYKLNTDPAWEKMKVIISDASVPGEGEHKIMEFIRSQRNCPEHDPNTRHVIYGLDADLIMLGLATHEPHFRVLREDVFFQQGDPRACRICGQVGHFAAACTGEAKKKQGEHDEKATIVQKPFIWLHVSVLREYLAIEMHPPGQNFKFELERALDDWVFMCFFVGNDFLPHLPSLEIRDQGIDTLIQIWRDNMPVMGGYVTRDGIVDLKRAQIILEGLAKQEDGIFRRRKEVEDRKERNIQRRKDDEQRHLNRQAGNKRQKNFNTGKYGDNMAPSADGLNLVSLDELSSAPSLPKGGPITHDMIVNKSQANKSAAAIMKERLKAGKSNDTSPPANGTTESEPLEASASALGKRTAEEMQNDEQGTPGRSSPDPKPVEAKPADDEPPPDTVKLWEEGYGDRYYEQKFHVSKDDIAFRNKVANAYVEGLAWVLLYYFQGCPSWTWYYPYHYAPFAADFKDLDQLTLKFDKGKPFKPYEQLMGVMPAASNHTIPPVFHSLMTDEDSDIVDFYPEDFQIDLNGKKWAWQGVAILPFIDEKRLLTAMATKYPHLTEDEVARNELGKDALIFSNKHPLSNVVSDTFYSKKKSKDNKLEVRPHLSDGLMGIIEKNEDWFPETSLVYPGETKAMEDIEFDASVMVHFEFPHSDRPHKSMLLRGLKMPTPALDDQDKHATADRARNSGRSFGGAPLGHNGRGRGRGRGGGQINYQAGPSRGDSNDHGGHNGHQQNFHNPLAHMFPNGVPPPPVPGQFPGFPPPPFQGQFGQGAPPMPFPPPPMPGQGGFGYGYPPQPDPHYQGGRGGYQNGGGHHNGGGYQNGGGQYRGGRGRY
ncbi:hypothetical protein FH972_024904 [Carpinus fangiana]|uniref:5'-3' exoribonuclease n=1 Tax=Carpinus fangiana TaxID=176857 RepID=A0A5N6L020_9ROSI|nr:hypothetical protein FH972_024904 [Carpinus fangiana]